MISPIAQCQAAPAEISEKLLMEDSEQRQAVWDDKDDRTGDERQQQGLLGLELLASREQDKSWTKLGGKTSLSTGVFYKYWKVFWNTDINVKKKRVTRCGELGCVRYVSDLGTIPCQAAVEFKFLWDDRRGCVPDDWH